LWDIHFNIYVIANFSQSVLVKNKHWLIFGEDTDNEKLWQLFLRHSVEFIDCELTWHLFKLKNQFFFVYLHFCKKILTLKAAISKHKINTNCF